MFPVPSEAGEERTYNITFWVPCNSKRLFAEIVRMIHRKALPLVLSLLMACNACIALVTLT